VSLHPNFAEVLILIPAYNEQGAIRHVVHQVREIGPEVDVVVVDDGSADNTAQEALAAGATVLQHPFNLGIGGAVQTGLRFAWQAGYNFVIRLDGDGQHNPADIVTIGQALLSQQADVVVGSRFLEQKSTLPIPFARRLGIRLFALAASGLTGQRATDTTSGFFGLNRRAMSLLITYMPQDYPEIESRLICHKAGLTTLELPVTMNPRLSGVSSIHTWNSIYYAFKVSVAVLMTIFKDISQLPQETPYVYTLRATSNGYHPQPYPITRDNSVDSQA
jgi:glycosyltransferase involved in cell wall biosynthesis